MSTSSFGGESNTPTDVQIEMPPLQDGQHGYHRLASVMGLFPDLAIFRRFATLNVQNILYLQAELVDLEKTLEETALADSLSGDINRREHHRAWYPLSHAKLFPGSNADQWNTFLRTREVLQQYSKWKCFPSWPTVCARTAHRHKIRRCCSKRRWRRWSIQIVGSCHSSISG